MRKLLLIVFSFMIITSLIACGDQNNIPSEILPQPEQEEEDNSSGDTVKNMKIQIIINSTKFIAILQDNATAKAFKALLPMTIDMNELNHNEKYYDLSNILPAAAINPETIHNGDITLYGSRTLVLFYKTFSTPYSYTKIGNIENTSGLEATLGGGKVTVTFEELQE